MSRRKLNSKTSLILLY